MHHKPRTPIETPCFHWTEFDSERDTPDGVSEARWFTNEAAGDVMSAVETADDGVEFFTLYMLVDSLSTPSPLALSLVLRDFGFDVAASQRLDTGADAVIGFGEKVSS